MAGGGGGGGDGFGAGAGGGDGDGISKLGIWKPAKGLVGAEAFFWGAGGAGGLALVAGGEGGGAGEDFTSSPPFELRSPPRLSTKLAMRPMFSWVVIVSFCL